MPRELDYYLAEERCSFFHCRESRHALPEMYVLVMVSLLLKNR